MNRFMKILSSLLFVFISVSPTFAGCGDLAMKCYNNDTGYVDAVYEDKNGKVIKLTDFSFASFSSDSYEKKHLSIGPITLLSTCLPEESAEDLCNKCSNLIATSDNEAIKSAWKEALERKPATASVYYENPNHSESDYFSYMRAAKCGTESLNLFDALSGDFRTLSNKKVKTGEVRKGGPAFHYTSWDGSFWVARIVGDTFIHHPKDEPENAHMDDIINYILPGGDQWTARISGKKFIHNKKGVNRSHEDTILKYVYFDGSTWLVSIQ